MLNFFWKLKFISNDMLATLSLKITLLKLAKR